MQKYFLRLIIVVSVVSGALLPSDVTLAAEAALPSSAHQATAQNVLSDNDDLWLADRALTQGLVVLRQANSPPAQQFLETQTAWRAERDACGQALPCLRQSYAARQQQLTAVLQTVVPQIVQAWFTHPQNVPRDAGFVVDRWLAGTLTHSDCLIQAPGSGELRWLPLRPHQALAEILCARGPYQNEYRYVWIDERRPQLKVLQFPCVSQEYCASAEVMIGEPHLKHTILTNFSKARGVGDCGTWARYAIDSQGEVTVLEARERTCPTVFPRADMPNADPKTWPLSRALPPNTKQR